MWKKEDDRQDQRTGSTYVEGSSAAPARAPGGGAVIGRSITIKGEVTGDEDLVIQGRVDGSVDLQQHAVTVGPEGQVKANITGRIVTVEGKVEGNVTGDEQVLLRRGSWVQGDLKGPRVVLEDGAHFRGGVQMGEDLALSRRAASATPAPKPSPSVAPSPQPAHVPPAQPAAQGARSATAKTADMKG
jgi:cytoskeletal protein CcmA (bactofilin family)